MPRRPAKGQKRLSATAMAHRSAAQYGQYSAPTYSTSGLPPVAAGGPGTEKTEPEDVGPAPTAVRGACGTVALAGRAVPVEEAAQAEPGLAEPPGFWAGLMRTNATTTTMTARTLPPTMRIWWWIFIATRPVSGGTSPAGPRRA